MADTSTGLKENVAGVLCYVLGWITGIVFLILEPNNKFVRFHAFHSIIIFGCFTVANLVFGWIPVIHVFMIPLLGAFAFIVWIAMMVVASQGKKYKLPWSGDLAEKWAG
jgi:uncharacterized membrane protein